MSTYAAAQAAKLSEKKKAMELAILECGNRQIEWRALLEKGLGQDGEAMPIETLSRLAGMAAAFLSITGGEIARRFNKEHLRVVAMKELELTCKDQINATAQQTQPQIPLERIQKLIDELVCDTVKAYDHWFCDPPVGNSLLTLEEAVKTVAEPVLPLVVPPLPSLALADVSDSNSNEPSSQPQQVQPQPQPVQPQSQPQSQQLSAQKSSARAMGFGRLFEKGTNLFTPASQSRLYVRSDRPLKANVANAIAAAAAAAAAAEAQLRLRQQKHVAKKSSGRSRSRTMTVIKPTNKDAVPKHNLIAMKDMIAAPRKAATSSSVSKKSAGADVDAVGKGQHGSLSSQWGKSPAPFVSAMSLLQEQLLPGICCCCSGDIAVKKAVLLQCECVLSFCLECARRQLFESMRVKTISTDTLDVLSVYCPSCKQRPVVGNELKGSNLVAASIIAAESAEQSLVCYRPLIFSLFCLYIISSSFSYSDIFVGFSSSSTVTS